MAYRSDRNRPHGDRMEGRGLEREGAYRTGPRRPERDEDRGFFERAGEEVRSWFGGDEQDRHRDRDRSRRDDPRSWFDDEEERRRYFARRDEMDRSNPPRGWDGDGGRRENRGRDRGPEAWSGDDRFTGGFGNQTPGSGVGRRADPFEPAEPALGTHEGSPSSRAQGQGGVNDPYYEEWRSRRVSELDRDYEDYRREREARFEEDFSNWRREREEKRKLLGKVKEGSEVVGSDGEHVGRVDKVRGDHIVLARKDENAGGVHHAIPCSWLEDVGKKVTLNRTAGRAMDEWSEEDRSRALFEPEDSGSTGPHMLNRSFSGTY